MIAKWLAAWTATLCDFSFDANQTAASQVVGPNSSKLIHIRLTNVAASSEAYVVYC
ncbi:MAG TPA: hypothetical protein VK148_29645 [Xanthobacteraceae bacterium]|nr:hypothetical protein [Xanthobacteraceae bacterium]